MQELDEYIRKCNLVFTNTVGRLDFCRFDFDIDKVKINYDNSISLFNLISSFNKLYLSFKKEYEELEKLNMGKYVSVLSFDTFYFDEEYYRVLSLYIDEPTITKHGDTFLFLREINGEMKPFVTNNKNTFDKDYYRENIELDSSIAKKYLDLFEIYSLLLDLYNKLKNEQIFGDGTNSIFTVIDEYKSNLLEGLNKFKIIVCSAYFDTEYYIDLPVNLGEDFGLDYDNCQLILDSENVQADKEDYSKVLTNIYLNKKYTEMR